MVVAWLRALEIKAFEFRLHIKVQSIGLTFGLESGYDERIKNKTSINFGAYKERIVEAGILDHWTKSVFLFGHIDTEMPVRHPSRD